MKKKIIGIFVMMLLIATALPVLGDIKEDTSKQYLTNNNNIDEYIIDFMNNRDIPGLSAGIVKSDEIVWKNAYGYANIEENILVENTTLFYTASISKTITGTALMQLYEQDYFELDDPINDYLPFQVKNPNYDTDITFLMLVTHTSSIKDNWDNMPYYEGDPTLPLGYYLEEYLTPGGEFYSASDNFRKSEPGTSFSYCNVATALVGYLVEVISDMPFDDYCQIHIFDPLDMYETAWFLAGLNISNIAIPYGPDFEPYEHYGFICWPAGQLRSSAPQLCNFMISMLNNGTFQSNSILNEDTVNLIFTPHFTEIPLGFPADLIGIFWWGEDDWDELYWLHWGSDFGCRTEIRIYPSSDIGIVVLTNGPMHNNLNPLVNRLYEYGIEITNSPPDNPICEYHRSTDELSLVSTDADNDQIRYGISWDNNQIVDEWTDYNNSGLEVRIDCDNHKGTVGVIAEDVYGGQSEWVSVKSKSKPYINTLFLNFLQQYPSLFPLLRLLLQRLELQ
jgi:CubicO group peptidase (beta-lactamase class C family)